ncbi:MAG: hypothetical protein BWY61_01972 [Firmicutes bacterium ADurb.Bin354]|nr:MAG: hypothetical protein BWY61_01972 [Firmicutes bacterium ADurb.Bin354]
MYSRNTVYAEAVMYIYMRHVNDVIFIDYGSLGIRIFLLRKLIKLPDDGNKLRNNFLEIFQRPCLKRFRKDSMIRICAGLRYHINSFFHSKSLVVDKDTDELRYYHCRMSIIDLDHRMFIHPAKIVIMLLHIHQDQLSRIAHHEILLINTKQITFLIRIIRIQE